MTEEDNAMNTEVDTGENINVGEHLGQVQWFKKQKGFGFSKNVILLILLQAQLGLKGPYQKFPNCVAVNIVSKLENLSMIAF